MLTGDFGARGIGYIKLGRLFGVGHTTVENIVHRKKWAHVVDGEDEGLGR